jgi:class 3 adenylate cyclase
VIASFEKDRVRETFARFVPERVVDEALATAEGQRLGGVRRECTVLFSDIRGFTTFSEQHSPDETIEVLNQYLSEMSAAIMDHGGTICSYIGDGIMALFGAPLEQPDHADRALAAAREMVGRRLETVNGWLVEEAGLAPFRMGVGLNTGPLMAGNVGSDQRLEYTAIGDTVNTASRLEGMTKNSGYEVFVSDQTRAALTRADDSLELVGDLEVRGRSRQMRVWGVQPDAGLPMPEPPREREPVQGGRPSDGQLAAIPIFALLTGEERAELRGRGTVAIYDAGDTVLFEDAPASAVYAIVSGRVGVFRNDGEVAKLGPGEFFGELGVFSRGSVRGPRRSATVVAGSRLELIAFEADEIRELVRRMPELGEAIAKEGARRSGELVAE